MHLSALEICSKFMQPRQCSIETELSPLPLPLLPSSMPPSLNFPNMV